LKGETRERIEKERLKQKCHKKTYWAPGGFERGGSDSTDGRTSGVTKMGKLEGDEKSSDSQTT